RGGGSDCRKRPQICQESQITATPLGGGADVEYTGAYNIVYEMHQIRFKRKENNKEVEYGLPYKNYKKIKVEKGDLAMTETITSFQLDITFTDGTTESLSSVTQVTTISDNTVLRAESRDANNNPVIHIWHLDNISVWKKTVE
ncbi:MAG: hypothetical protein ACE5F1_11510, partial [Planctomycetota bacterium]